MLDPPVVLYRGDRDARGTALEIPYDLDGWKRASVAATAVDFVEAIQHRRQPLVTAAAGRYVVRLVELAYASIAADGKTVSAREAATA